MSACKVDMVTGGGNEIRLEHFYSKDKCDNCDYKICCVPVDILHIKG